MFIPKKPKYRKQMKRSSHLDGKETRGCKIVYGDFALKAMESGWIKNNHLEAARVAVAREAKRGGKLWIKLLADKPLTSKPAEVRMGKGKGATEMWVAEVRAGKIIVEMAGVTEEVAKKALALAASKMPIKTKFVKRSEFLI